MKRGLNTFGEVMLFTVGACITGFLIIYHGIRHLSDVWIK